VTTTDQFLQTIKPEDLKGFWGKLILHAVPKGVDPDDPRVIALVEQARLYHPVKQNAQ